MKSGILRLFMGECGKVGYYNVQEVGMARALAAHGIQTYVFLLEHKRISSKMRIEEVEQGVSIVYIPATNIGSHGFFDINTLEQFNLDVLHIMTDIQAFTPKAIKWARKKNIPVISHIGTITTSSNNKIKKMLTDTIFMRNSRYLRDVVNIAKTPSIYNKIIEKKITNLKMIPVGLDANLLNSNIISSKQELRKEFSLPSDGKVLLFIGRLEEEKKPEFALNLLEYLCRTKEKYFLIMIGDGGLKERVIKSIEEKGLRDNVVFFDKLSNQEIWKAYCASDIFINLNSHEIYGMCILEAMYYKCPIVAISAPGPNYMIDHMKNGVLVNDYKLYNWEHALELALRNGEELGESAHNKVVEKLTWNAVTEHYIDIYCNLGLRLI